MFTTVSPQTMYNELGKTLREIEQQIETVTHRSMARYNPETIAEHKITVNDIVDAHTEKPVLLELTCAKAEVQSAMARLVVLSQEQKRPRR